MPWSVVRFHLSQLLKEILLGDSSVVEHVTQLLETFFAELIVRSNRLPYFVIIGSTPIFAAMAN